MAKVHKNVVIRGVNGSIGGLVFREMPNGRTYVSAKPDFHRRKFSGKQKQHQSRFQEAVQYAREAAKRQPVYAELARGTVLSPYNIALSDWFHAPVIHAVERRDGVIEVRASDNVLVARVEVTVRDEAGAVLARGEAVQSTDEVWVFATEAVGSVTVRVWDLAGNVAEGELIIDS